MIMWIILAAVILAGIFTCAIGTYQIGRSHGITEGLKKGRKDCESEWDGWSRFKEVAVQEKLQELMEELGLESNSCVEERTENDKE